MFHFKVPAFADRIKKYTIKRKKSQLQTGSVKWPVSKQIKEKRVLYKTMPFNIILQRI
jgi:hypothetical protein